MSPVDWLILVATFVGGGFALRWFFKRRKEPTWEEYRDEQW